MSYRFGNEKDRQKALKRTKRRQRLEKLGIGAVIGLWVVGILMTIAFWVAVIWGIIALVGWITTQ